MTEGESLQIPCSRVPGLLSLLLIVVVAGDFAKSKGN